MGSDNFASDVAGSGDNGPSDVNPDTGGVTLTGTDVSSDIAGFAQTRQWTSDTALGSSGNLGNGTFSPQQALLSQPYSGTLSITQGAGDVLWFDGSDAAGWVERYAGRDTLQHLTSGGNANQYLLTNTLGTRLYFYDFSHGSLSGKLVQTIDDNGNATNYTYDANQRLSTMSRTVNGTTETLTYSYNSPAPNTNLASGITLSQGGDGVIEQVQYAYYGGGAPGGNQSDLESATTEDGAGHATGTTFYRYYTSGQSAGGVGSPSGQVGDLEYVFTDRCIKKFT